MSASSPNLSETQKRALRAAALDPAGGVRACRPIPASVIQALGRLGYMEVRRDADGVLGMLTPAGRAVAEVSSAAR